MEKINITFLPYKKNISVDRGITLLEALTAARIHIYNACGGEGVCGGCKVIVKKGEYKTEYKGTISQEEKKQGYVLACKTIPETDLEVFIPKESREEDISILSDEIKSKLFTPFDSLNDTIIDSPIKDKSKSKLGVALDIGTTTIVAYLIDINSKKILDKKASYNPQSDFGEDVISRIIYAGNESGLEKLHNAALDTINTLITAMAEEKDVSLEDITSMACAGNTTMIHLLLKIDPKDIRKLSYVPLSNSRIITKSGSIGINVNPNADLTCLPLIGSYVGGDIVGGVLASGMNNTEDLSLFIDLGTNGEIVIGTKDYFMTCSTSAGPCFEGGGLSCGIRAMKGAIEGVYVRNKKLHVKTIKDGKPKGICGSGIIDILSAFLENKIIDRLGKIKDNDICNATYRDGVKEIILVSKEDSETGKNIFIDEADIKNVIHSKGAVYTGIESLVTEAGYKTNDLKHVFIAGGLGTSLNIRSSINIGLLPDLDEKIFEFLGNTSIAGAKLCLISEKAMNETYSIKERTDYIDLSTLSGFMNNYSASLFLPHTDIEKFPSVEKILKLID